MDGRSLHRIAVLSWFTALLAVVSCGSDRDDPFQLIDHENADIRAEAARTLREHPGPEAMVALRRRLQDADYRVRLAAMSSLVHLGRERVVPDLAFMVDDVSLDVRLAAVEALGEIGGSAVEEPLLSALDDRHVRVRRLAAQVLVEEGVTSADQVRRLALHHRTAAEKQAGSSAWPLRLEAARELAECGDDHALGVLERLVRDRDLSVAEVAAEGIGRAASEAGAERLGRVLSSPRAVLRSALLRGLRESPADLPAEVISAVCEQLSSEETSREAAHVVAARRLRCSPDSVGHLAQWLDGDQEDRRLEAAGTIVILGDPAIGAALVQRAAALLWTTARVVDLLAVAGLPEQPRDPAYERVRSELERYTLASERWVPLPEAVGEEQGAEEPPARLSGLSESEALGAILSRYPPRVRGWVELFPPDVEPPDVAALLVLAREVGLELDRQPLEELAQHGADPQVRAAAVWALGGGETHLQDEDPLIRAAAAESLQGRAPEIPGATKARLAYLLTDDAPGVRRAAATTLAATGDPHAVRPLIAAFERWREPGLARALGTLGQDEAIAPLEAYLRATGAPLGSEVAIAALEALGRLGGPEQIESVVMFLDHPEAPVRAAAVRAARSIGGPRAESLVGDRQHDFALVVREAVTLPSGD